MGSKVAALALISCMVLQACSSRPREFRPTFATPVNETSLEAAYTACQKLLVDGKLDANGRSGSLAAGAGAGAGTAAVGSTAAAVAGGWGGVAVASATVILLPFAIVGGAWGMSRMKRARKERAVKIAMEGCLQERGFAVVGWSRDLGKPVAANSAKAME